MSGWSSRHSYTEGNVEKYVPAGGGVYRLINKDGDKYYVFYVGQSNDLERRLLEHLSPNEIDTCIKRYLLDYDCFFRFKEINSASERDRVEQEQIKKYNPSCNG